MSFDVEAIATRSAELETASPFEILEHVLTQYSPRVAISTAFGVEGCALIHMAVQIRPDVQVFTVDTDFLFTETQQLKQQFVDRYNLNLRTFKGDVTLAEQQRRYGPALFERDTNTCCALRKVEPTRRALVGLDCWIAGLRRDQSSSRASISILERYQHDDGSPLIKAHPLAKWTRNDTWRYVLDNDVPYNPLLDRGYTSIGCYPCTRPISAGEDERAGRWNGAKSECGIHQTLVPLRRSA